MNKDVERKYLLLQLSELPNNVLATALLVSKDIYRYGVNTTDNCSKAYQQHVSLEKVYMQGIQRGRELEREDMNKIKNYIDTDIAQTKYLLNSIYGKNDKS